MKPFNLEEAKAGKPVCTRDGKDARIVCFDRKNEYYPLIVLINDGDREDLNSHTLDGKRSFVTSPEDLFMKSEKKEGWINIYSFMGELRLADGRVHSTKEAAVANGEQTCDKHCKMVATVKIEWEE